MSLLTVLRAGTRAYACTTPQYFSAHGRGVCLTCRSAAASGTSRSDVGRNATALSVLAAASPSSIQGAKPCQQALDSKRVASGSSTVLAM